MNFHNLDQALIKIIEQRNTLNKLDSNDQKYQSVNLTLKKLETDFLQQYGPETTEVIMDVYDEFCPDIEMVSPLNYVASSYKNTGNTGSGPKYDVSHDQGVFVEMDDYPNKPTKLVFVPNPFRIILNIDSHTREEVWSSYNMLN